MLISIMNFFKKYLKSILICLGTGIIVSFIGLKAKHFVNSRNMKNAGTETSVSSLSNKKEQTDDSALVCKGIQILIPGMDENLQTYQPPRFDEWIQTVPNEPSPIAKIGNNGKNSCYFDSLMLQLYNIPELRKVFLEYNGTEDNLASYLKEIFEQMTQSIKSGQQIKFDILKSKFTKKYNNIYNGEQKDTAETYDFILNKLHEESPDLYNKINGTESNSTGKVLSDLLYDLGNDSLTLENAPNYLVINNFTEPKFENLQPEKTIKLKDGTTVLYSLIGCTLHEEFRFKIQNRFIQGGHYTSLVKEPDTNKWYYEDDLTTDIPKEPSDLLPNKIQMLSDRTPNLLFYKKVVETSDNEEQITMSTEEQENLSDPSFTPIESQKETSFTENIKNPSTTDDNPLTDSPTPSPASNVPLDVSSGKVDTVPIIKESSETLSNASSGMEGNTPTTKETPAISQNTSSNTEANKADETDSKLNNINTTSENNKNDSYVEVNSEETLTKEQNDLSNITNSPTETSKKASNNTEVKDPLTIDEDPLNDSPTPSPASNVPLDASSGEVDNASIIKESSETLSNASSGMEGNTPTTKETPVISQNTSSNTEANGAGEPDSKDKNVNDTSENNKNDSYAKVNLEETLTEKQKGLSI